VEEETYRSTAAHRRWVVVGQAATKVRWGWVVATGGLRGEGFEEGEAPQAFKGGRTGHRQRARGLPWRQGCDGGDGDGTLMASARARGGGAWGRGDWMRRRR
jgi:hypothetical protein